jgi:hypothetical protein
VRFLLSPYQHRRALAARAARIVNRTRGAKEVKVLNPARVLSADLARVDLIRAAARAVNPAARDRDHKAVSPAKDRAASLVLPANQRTRAELAQATTHARALKRRATRTPVRSVRVERINRARDREAAHRALDGCLQARKAGNSSPEGFPALFLRTLAPKNGGGQPVQHVVDSVTDSEPLTPQSGAGASCSCAAGRRRCFVARVLGHCGTTLLPVGAGEIRHELVMLPLLRRVRQPRV